MAQDDIHNLLDDTFDRLFPILRSISGPGLEASYRVLGEHMPLDYLGVPTGQTVFDWTTPPEWHCRRATLTDPEGAVVCDTDVSNLHVLNYSEGFHGSVPLDRLQSHLHSLPHLPDTVPYVTSYYNRTWGFCLAHNVRQNLKQGDYCVAIDAEFKDGQIPLAQTVLKGTTDREVLISSYLCHPSLANNELSGPLVLLALYRALSRWEHRTFTYRFLLNPETIGSLCYLWLDGERLRSTIEAGLVLTCLGGPSRRLSFKATRRGDTRLDRLARSWADREPETLAIRPFTPTSGSDERQFCSPGFNLPVGQFARTIYGEYAGYHNALDTKAFMGIDALVESASLIERFLKELDAAGPYVNQAPFGEPQLGRRDLYPTLNSAATWQHSSDAIFDGRTTLERVLTILNYSDGTYDLIDIAGKCGCSVTELLPVVNKLRAGGLLKDART